MLLIQRQKAESAFKVFTPIGWYFKSSLKLQCTRGLRRKHTWFLYQTGSKTISAKCISLLSVWTLVWWYNTCIWNNRRYLVKSFSIWRINTFFPGRCINIPPKCFKHRFLQVYVVYCLWCCTGMDYLESTLVQVMAWRRQAADHYLCHCWPISLSPYGVIRG